MKKLLKLFAWFREAMILRRHLSFLYEMQGSISFAGGRVTVFLHPRSPASCIMAHGQTIQEALEVGKLKLAADKIEQKAMIAPSESLVKAGAAGADQ